MDEKIFVTEMRHLPFLPSANFRKEKLLPPNLLNKIYDFKLQERFPNVCICLRILLTIPTTVTSAERSLFESNQRSIPCGLSCQIEY